jgi:hypothetical protein
MRTHFKIPDKSHTPVMKLKKHKKHKTLKQRHKKKYRKTPYYRKRTFSRRTHKRRTIKTPRTRKGGFLSIKPFQAPASSMTPQEEAYQKMMKSTELQNHLNTQTGGAEVAVPQLQQADPMMNSHLANIQRLNLQASANRMYDGNIGKDASADSHVANQYVESVNELSGK